MSEYFLSKHAYLRLTGEGAIVLDLHRDEYLTLSRDQVTTLNRIVQGWPADLSFDLNPSTNANIPVAEFTGMLLERGLITADAFAGKSAIQLDLEPAETSLIEQDNTSRAHSLEYGTNFIGACIRTSLALRLRRLDQIVSSIERRKRAHASTLRRVSADTLQELMGAFLFMRPFVYTERDKCLFDSLALVHFLAAYRIFPSLVFGVRIHPFEAHAWVQDGRCALNYAAEYVRGFSPIMVI